jgi:hypothetical protein
MKVFASLLVALALLSMNKLSGTAAPQTPAPEGPSVPLHVSSSFHFLVHAPLSCAAPLFGPNGELAWAGKHWDPQFLYPQPGQDVQGAVFTVRHGSMNSIWINTLFDLGAGRMQYVSLIQGIMITTVNVRLTSVDSSTTRVDVTYTRTALDPSANDHVQQLAESDRDSGPEWEKSIAPAVANCGK